MESWLSTLKLANGTRAKIRNIMSGLYSHAWRVGLHQSPPPLHQPTTILEGKKLFE